MPWCFKPLFGYLFDKLIYILKKSKYIMTISVFIKLFIYLCIPIFMSN